MNESQFQRRLKMEFEKRGALVFNVHGHMMQQGGWPDLQVYHWSWSGHLELKVDGGNIDQRQRRVMMELVKRRTAVFVLRLRNEEIDSGRHEYAIEVEGTSDNILDYSRFEGGKVLDVLQSLTHRLQYNW